VAQTAGVGTFCWGGGCVRKVGILTAVHPLVVTSPLSGTLALGLDAAPSHLALAVYPVTEEDQVASGDDFRAWRPRQEGRQETVERKVEQPLRLVRDPGMYVLQLVAVWEGEGRGDVIYGFLVEFEAERSNPPPLAVTIGGAAHDARLGSYCWDGLCADTFAAITQAVPVRARAPLTLTLTLGLADPPAELGYRLFPVARAEALRSGEDWIAWPWKNVPFTRLAHTQSQALRLPGRSGWHVLEFLVRWEGRDRGDASYGLLLDLTGPVYLPLAARSFP